MTDRDSWPDNPNDPPARTQQWKDSSGGGGCWKVALVVGGIGFLCMLVCCGGVGWFVWSFVPTMASNPADVSKLGQQVLQIDLPEDYVGDMGMSIDNWLVSMKIANYRHKDGKGSLLIGALQVKVGDISGHQARFNSHTAEHSDQDQKLIIRKTEEREFTVRGRKVPFKFSEADEAESGKKFRQVSGQIDGSNAITIFQLTLEEEAYDDEAVVKMIESIK